MPTHYGQQKKKQTFNYTSGIQNALSVGSQAAMFSPYLALPAAAVGFYTGGKSGPFQPHSSDYKILRDAYDKYEQSANKNLQAGVDRIGQQTAQRVANQGLYGSPLANSIIQNNQNYTLQSGMSDLNNQRLQFETGIAQNKFNAQQAYDQQMQQQWIGTLSNLATTAPFLYAKYFQPKPKQLTLPQRFDVLENASKGSPLAPKTPMPPTDVELARQRILTQTPRTPIQQQYTQEQLRGFARDVGGLSGESSTPKTQGATKKDDEPMTPQQKQAEKDKARNDGEGAAAELAPELAEEIRSLIDRIGNVFDFHDRTPLKPLGSLLDRAQDRQIARDATPPVPISRTPGGVYGDAPQPEIYTPPTGPGRDYVERNPNYPPATVPDDPQKLAPGVQPYDPLNPPAQPTTPVPNPPAILDPVTVTARRTPIEHTPGGVYDRQPPQVLSKEELTIPAARDLIIFGETDTTGKYARNPIVDPKSGYNIGWGRSITNNGIDVQDELIPMLRASTSDPNRVTQNYLRSKLSTVGISLTQTGKVRLTPKQFRKLFPTGINQNMADMLLDNDIPAFIGNIKTAIGEDVYNNLSVDRQAVLIDMMYTLGLQGFQGFKKMIKWIRAGDYVKAAAEMRNSIWYNDVKSRRADPLIQRMIGGGTVPVPK